MTEETVTEVTEVVDTPGAPDIPPIGEPPGDEPPRTEPELTELDKREIARKIELGKRKAAEKRAEDAERRANEAEGRVKLLREQSEKPKEKIYTLAEVNAARRAGQITDQVADEYIEKIIIPNVSKAQSDADKAQAAKLAPLQKAEAEVAKWIEVMPELSDTSSEAFQKVAKQMKELVDMGYEDSWATRATAARLAHGSLESRQRKQELAGMNRNPQTIATERSGGGTPTNGKIDISKAPASMRAKWDSMGFDQAARERSFKLMNEQQAERARRTGRNV